MKKRRLIGVIALLAMMMACGLVACDSDVPEVPKDPQEPEAPVEIEPLPEEFRPVLTDGKRWVVEFARVNEEWSSGKGDLTRDTVCYWVCGDAIINGRTAKKIKSDKRPKTDVWIDSVFLEIDGNVYMSWPNADPKDFWCDLLDGRWAWMYDVKTTGSHGDSHGDIKIPLISRGTIIAENKTRRVAKVRSQGLDKSKYPYDYWIEGVGSIYCIWHDFTRVQHACPRTNYMVRILECYDGDVKIFDAKKFDESSYTPLEVFGE